jgi:hypothetical protein
MLGVRRLSTPDAPVGGPDVQKLSFLSAPPLPSGHHRLKKSCITVTPLRRAPARLSSAFLSTTAMPAPPWCAPPRPHHHSVLAARGRTTRLLMSSPCMHPIAGACAAARPLPSSFSTVTAHPGSHYACSAT